MTILLDGTSGITSPGGDTATVSVATPILKSPSSLTFQTNGSTTAVTVDTSGNVGIATTPAAWGSGWKALQVTGSGPSLWSDGSQRTFLSNNLYFDGSNRKYLSTGFASEYQQSGSGTHVWTVAPSGTAGSNVTLTQALTLNNNGALALQGASITANGIGITFPAAQSASSNANTLDDYEEGTWTPIYSLGVNSPVYLDTAGYYIKIGSVVYVAFRTQLVSGAGNASHLQIAGLPFTSAPGAGSQGAFTVGYNGGFKSDGNITWLINSNQATMAAYTWGGGIFAGSTASSITSTLHVSGFYLV